MNTYLLRIQEFDPIQNAWPLELREWPIGAAGGPLASATIPQSLQLPGMASPIDRTQMGKDFASALGADDTLSKHGAQLYDLIMQDAIGAVLQTLPPETRVVLDVRDPNLKAWPWELLWRQQDQFPLFGDPQRPFCRGVLGNVAPMQQDGWPLRMLIVIGCTPNDPAVEPQAEIERIQDAFLLCDPDVDLEILRQPTRAQLRTRLQEFKPHIFHFIGHGGVEPPPGNAFLVLTSELGAEQWFPVDIRNDLFGVDTVRLAFINACRTSDPGKERLWSIADAFLNADIPAVLTMRTDVAGTEAGRIAGEFYRALVPQKNNAGVVVDGEAVDVALARARRATSSVQAREFYAPCLEVRGLPETILRFGQGIDLQQRQAVFATRDFQHLRKWVDRRPERKSAWDGMAMRKLNLLVLTGRKQIGKSEFAKLLMERCALSRHELRYIDLKGEREASYITVLRKIRDGVRSKEAPTLTKALPAAAFADFNRELNRVLGAQPAVGQEAVDQNAPRRDEAYQEQALEQIFQNFRQGLEQAAPNPPLVLVFDHLDMNGSEFEPIKHYLLQPYVEARSEKVRFVLILSDEQFSRFTIQDTFGQDYLRLPVAGFPPGQLVELTIEFIRRNLRPPLDWSPEKLAEKFVELRQRVSDFWDGTIDEIDPSDVELYPRALLRKGWQEL